MESKVVPNYCYNTGNELADTVKEFQETYACGAGIVTLVLAAWMAATISSSALKYMPGYGTVMHFVLIAGIRRTYPFAYRYIQTVLEPYLKPYIEKYLNSFMLSDFVHNTLSVMESESLTLVFVERLVNANDVTCNRAMSPFMNKWYFLATLFFSLGFSYSALQDDGPNVHLFDYVTCSDNLFLGTGYERYCGIMLFTMKIIKPLVFMLLCLYIALSLETSLDYNRSFATMKLTEGVTMMAIVHTIMILPTLMLHVYNIHQKMAGNDPNPPRNIFSLAVASVLYASDTTIGMLVLMCLDRLLFINMLNLMYTRASVLRNFRIIVHAN